MISGDSRDERTVARAEQHRYVNGFAVRRDKIGKNIGVEAAAATDLGNRPLEMPDTD